jgi:branched-chain amino acid aminotransferase
MIAYWNGKFVEDSEISISAFDLGVLRGYGVFDVMRTENGKPYNTEKHWQRFTNSAKLLGLTIPVTEEEFKSTLLQLAEKNISEDVPNVNFRAVLTGGPSSDAFHPEKGRETFFILATPFSILGAEVYENGAKLITLEHQRDLAEAKVTNYIKAIQNSETKKQQGATEILFVKEGKVKEASTSNFFAVIHGKLVTAKENILLGTTRNLVIDIAQEAGLEVEERDPNLEEVLAADEAFLTAVNKYIVPVTRIDEQTIGSGKPGRVTSTLSNLLQKHIQESL